MAANNHTSASAETAAAAQPHRPRRRHLRLPARPGDQRRPTAAGTTYDPHATHRLIVLLYASGNPFTPVNLVKELVPATGADVTGQNDKVDGKACLECHTSFRAITGGTGEFGTGEFHGGRPLRHPHLRRLPQRSAPLLQRRAPRVTEPAIAADGTWTGTAGVHQPRGGAQPPGLHPQDPHGQEADPARAAPTRASPSPTRPPTRRTSATAPSATARRRRWPTTGRTQPIQPRLRRLPRQRQLRRRPSPTGAIAHPGGPQANDAGCSTCHRPAAPAATPPPGTRRSRPPTRTTSISDATSAGNGNTNAA